MSRNVIRQKTIKDIAEIANVSISTVSRVINNPELVKEETRLKVQQAIKEMKFKPNALARGLIQNSSKAIGVVVQDIQNIFYTPVIRGIEEILNENHHSIFLCNTDGSVEKEVECLDSLLGRRADGIIFLGTRPAGVVENKHIFMLQKEVPIVMMFDHIQGLDVITVRNDEIQAAYDAVNYLAKLGHKKIAFINGEGIFSTYLRKQTGYHKALLENDLPIRPEYEIEVQPYEDGGYKGVNRLLDIKNKPTAVFTVGDQAAIGVYKGAYERGYKIPDDLSVIGFGNVPMTRAIYPEMTTVNQYPYEAGCIAAEVMVKTLKGEKIEDKDIIIDTDIVERKSCRVITG